MGVSAACGVSTSIASSLLAGVAVVDARPFFLGPIVFVVVVASVFTTSDQVEVATLQRLMLGKRHSVAWIVAGASKSQNHESLRGTCAASCYLGRYILVEWEVANPGSLGSYLRVQSTAPFAMTRSTNKQKDWKR